MVVLRTRKYIYGVKNTKGYCTQVINIQYFTDDEYEKAKKICDEANKIWDTMFCDIEQFNVEDCEND